jgi:hypothetical protein
LNEVSSQDLLFGRTACRDLRSLSAMQASPAGSGWQRGESMRSIGRVFDRQSSSVFSVISPTGGIRPPDRRRGKPALSLCEREEISRGLSTKPSLRTIARQVRRAPSTISREVRRNGGQAGYRATASDQAAWDRARRPKICKLACHPKLADAVSAKLRRKWSPEQVAGWLKRAFPREAHKQVSHALPPFGIMLCMTLSGNGTGYCVAMSREGNDLQKPLYTGARCPQKRAAGALVRKTHSQALSTRRP